MRLNPTAVRPGLVAPARPASALWTVALTIALGATATAQTRTGFSYDPPADAAAALAMANRAFARVPESDRAENVLLPALAKRTPPPAAAATLEAAALLAPGDAGWEAAAAWAEAPEQQATIEALKTITELGSRFVFALPYGDGAPSEFKEAGFADDLGQPPLLANAELAWLDAAEELFQLINVEATRLAAGGDVEGGVDLLLRFSRFARMVADREFLAEKAFGIYWTAAALERARDVIYTHPDALSDVQLRDFIDQLADREYRVDRILLPDGERIAALQVIGATMSRREGAGAESFGPTVARLAASERPLTLFGQAARWSKVASTHADWFDTIAELRNMYEDWQLRWALGPHDEILTGPTDYMLSDPARFALLHVVVPDVGILIDARLRLRTEIAGTRIALAVVAYKARLRNWPKPLFAVRGQFISALDPDPYDPAGVAAFSYFVPIRDQPQDIRRDASPHTIRVTWGGEESDDASDTGALMAVFDTLQRALTSAPVDVMRAEVEKSLRVFIDNDVNAGNIEQKWDQLPVDSRSIGGKGAPAGGGPALSEEEQRKMGIALYKALLNDPAVASAMDKLRRGRRLSDDEVRAVMQATIAHNRAAIMKVVKATAPPRKGAIQFAVDLDDSNFVLYSMGEDQIAGWAKEVGEDGDDILIWPPVISLAREHLTQSGGR